MLSDVRTNAGLGNPQVPFYTNVPESANAVIKRSVKFEENELSEFCKKISKVLLQQREDVRAAIVNRGPFRLDPKFIDLQVSQEKWFSMSAKQRERYQNRIRRKKPEDPQNLKDFYLKDFYLEDSYLKDFYLQDFPFYTLYMPYLRCPFGASVDGSLI